MNDTSGSPMAEALGEAADPRPCIDIHAGQAGYSWWMDEGVAHCRWFKWKMHLWYLWIMNGWCQDFFEFWGVYQYIMDYHGISPFWESSRSTSSAEEWFASPWEDDLHGTLWCSARWSKSWVGPWKRIQIHWLQTLKQPSADLRFWHLHAFAQSSWSCIKFRWNTTYESIYSDRTMMYPSIHL